MVYRPGFIWFWPLQDLVDIYGWLAFGEFSRSQVVPYPGIAASGESPYSKGVIPRRGIDLARKKGRKEEGKSDTRARTLPGY